MVCYSIYTSCSMFAIHEALKESISREVWSFGVG